MSDTVEFWSGEFGTEYSRRNAEVNWKARVPFWKKVLDETGDLAILEVGCNVGANLKAIREVLPQPEAQISGVDVNEVALDQATLAGFDVVKARADEICEVWTPGVAELVFTAGVLIHVAPDDLPRVMGEIVRMAGRHVLAIEYADTQEVEVEYRGHAGKLWRRNYGDLYLAMGGLSLLESGPAEGFDSCHYWLFEKA